MSVFVFQLCLFFISLDYDAVNNFGESVVGATHRVVSATRSAVVHIHAMLYTQVGSQKLLLYFSYVSHLFCFQ